jgi:hypothetical protein
MKKPLICLLTVASFAVIAKIDEWAIAIHNDKTIILTNAPCRYDTYFPEAQITSKDGKMTYMCY